VGISIGRFFLRGLRSLRPVNFAKTSGKDHGGNFSQLPDGSGLIGFIADEERGDECSNQSDEDQLPSKF